MKKFTFLQLANALRWMHDNTTGITYVINLFKYDIVIIKRDEKSSDLQKKINTQLKGFERIKEWLTSPTFEFW